jgi:diaminohydroxyphosphoribosylaminopyrimidine deaminase/5-amino-6-(5-phosphoribosylamino)uracil reductase
MVGAVIVKDGQVISSGYHRRFGGLHAEVEAIRSGGTKVRGATMYVNLEPCSHFGKTPPCVDEILKAGLREVIVSMIDPNPLVAETGIEKLRQSGVKVSLGLLASEAERLNESYTKYIVKHEPFVIMKAAVTLDGMIADASGNSQWISSESSRRFVHRLRRKVDSVLVGIETVFKDDPELTVRLVSSKRNPKRIVLDSRLRVPLEARVLDEAASTIIVTGVEKEKAKLLKRKGKAVWLVNTIAGGEIDLKGFLARAAAEGITSILVEGGRKVYSSFLRQRLVDKVYLFIAPKFLGDGIPLVEGLHIKRIEDSLQLKNLSLRRVDSDTLVIAYPQ